MSTVNVNISFVHRGVVCIKQDGVEIVLVNNTLTQEEMAFVACIAQLTKKLENGKFIDYDFDIKDFQSLNQLVKVEWLPRTGNLKIHGETNKKYHFVETTDAALAEHRTFTCLRRLVHQLPKVKPTP